MKQLDVDVSPPAFVWNPHMTFDLDQGSKLQEKITFPPEML